LAKRKYDWLFHRSPIEDDCIPLIHRGHRLQQAWSRIYDGKAAVAKTQSFMIGGQISGAIRATMGQQSVKVTKSSASHGVEDQ
jgi:hypothetical protein